MVSINCNLSDKEPNWDFDNVVVVEVTVAVVLDLPYVFSVLVFFVENALSKLVSVSLVDAVEVIFVFIDYWSF